jgi:hypothetical protein
MNIHFGVKPFPDAPHRTENLSDIKKIFPLSNFAGSGIDGEKYICACDGEMCVFAVCVCGMHHFTIC